MNDKPQPLVADMQPIAMFSSMGVKHERLLDLQRRRIRESRIPALIAEWSNVEVSVSPVSAGRQLELIGRLRESGLRVTSILQERTTKPLSEEIGSFTHALDMVVVVGWEVDEEPALLISAEAFNRSASHIRAIYPDGFLLIDLPLKSALVVDFDEDDEGAVYIDHLRLA